MNFFFWFNDTVLDRTLVQVVRSFQTSSPQLPQKIMIRTDLPEQVVNDWSMTYWLMIFSAKLLIIYIYINLNLNDSSVGPASTSEVLLLHSEQESTRSCFCSVMVGKEGAFLKIFGLFSCIDSLQMIMNSFMHTKAAYCRAVQATFPWSCQNLPAAISRTMALFCCIAMTQKLLSPLQCSMKYFGLNFEF